jgi:ribose transport system permease protein
MDVGERFAIVGVWVLLIVVYALAEPGQFLTTGTFQTIFSSQQALVFLTAALLCTICVGEFVDLSVPSILGLSAVLVPVLNVQHGWNVWLASAVALAVAVLAGAVNGWLVVYLGVNTIVVTLGMATLLLGVALWVTHLTAVSGLSSGFSKIALQSVGGLPVSFFEGAALMLVFAYLLAATPLGRNMRFVGANREVSRLAGVRVPRIRFGAFVFAGLICGVGGVLSTAATGGFDPTVSQSYLLPTFASTFLGTAIIQPGRFNPLGTFVAVYFLATGILGLQLLGVAGWVADVFYGGVLVAAVTISTLLRTRSA